MLPQPGVDAVRGGIFRNGVVLQPTATGVRVEVIAGVHGLIYLTQDGPRYEVGEEKKRKTVSAEQCVAA